MSTDVRARTAAYLSRFFPVHDLGDEDDIFEQGYVSSLFAMQLVAFVEQEFGVAVEEEDMDLEHFRSLRALDTFVARKLSARAGV
ncbi:acyl carrier protein [Streptomyces sp. NPDC057381]|uniref:acyl carrier protein n=1 Tax=unclassified Streptomyces TaxID=2593676 RepID=UPI003629AC4A